MTRVIIGARGENNARARFKQELTPEEFEQLPYVRLYGDLPAGMWAWRIEEGEADAERARRIEVVPFAVENDAGMLAGIRSYLEKEKRNRKRAESKSPMSAPEYAYVYARARYESLSELCKSLYPAVREDADMTEADMDAHAEAVIEINGEHELTPAFEKLIAAENALFQWARETMEQHEQYRAQREQMAHVWEVKNVRLRQELIDLCMKLRAPKAQNA